MRFVDEVRASLPPGLELPEPIAAAIGWLEANGCVERSLRTGQRYAKLPGTSLVTFQASDPAFVPDGMNVTEPEARRRLAPIVRTGGDGSHALLWRDPEARLRFVHYGSGSGSTMLTVLADDAVGFLRWLAIGYEEPAFDEQYPLTPAEAADENYLPPTAFQDWVAATYGVTIPRTGEELVPAPTHFDDEDATDDFWRWYQPYMAE